MGAGVREAVGAATSQPHVRGDGTVWSPSPVTAAEVMKMAEARNITINKRDAQRIANAKNRVIELQVLALKGNQWAVQQLDKMALAGQLDRFAESWLDQLHNGPAVKER